MLIRILIAIFTNAKSVILCWLIRLLLQFLFQAITPCLETDLNTDEVTSCSMTAFLAPVVPVVEPEVELENYSAPDSNPSCLAMARVRNDVTQTLPNMALVRAR